jgi:CheY-like chemotaxis protein
MASNILSEDRRPRFPTVVTKLACTIILADDDDDFRSMFAEILRLEGAHVIEASGGAAAIAMLDQLAETRDAERTLLVMDLMMPNMSGIEVLQRVRQSPRWRQLPVLIVTAINDPMLAVRLNVSVVFKPEIDALLEAIRRIAQALK